VYVAWINVFQDCPPVFHWLPKCSRPSGSKHWRSKKVVERAKMRRYGFMMMMPNNECDGHNSEQPSSSAPAAALSFWAATYDYRQAKGRRGWEVLMAGCALLCYLLVGTKRAQAAVEQPKRLLATLKPWPLSYYEKSQTIKITIIICSFHGSFGIITGTLFPCVSNF